MIWQLAISTFFTAVKVRDSCKQVGSQWTKLSLLSMSQCPFYSFPDSDHLLEFCVGQKMSGGGEMKKGASSSPQTTRKVMVRSMINVHYKLFLSMRNHLCSRYVSHVRLLFNSSRKQYWIMKQVKGCLHLYIYTFIGTLNSSTEIDQNGLRWIEN